MTCFANSGSNVTDGWESVPFGEAFRGKPRGLEIPQIDMASVQPTGRWPVVGQGSGQQECFTDDASQLFPIEQLPVILYGPHTRRVRLLTEPFVAGPNVRFIWPAPGFDTRYAYYMALAAEVPSRGYNDHFTLFKEQTFLRPPLPDQVAIAGVVRAVDEAREATEQLIAASYQLMRSMAAHLFTYGPVPIHGTASVPWVEDDDLGRRPSHWVTKRLDDVCDVVTGRTPPTVDAANFGGDVPFFTPGDLGGRLRLRSAARTLTQRGLATGRPIPAGSTLLVCIGATIGKVGLTEIGPSTTNQQINALIPRDGLDSEYLAYLIVHLTQRIVARARSTTLPILSKGSLASLRVAQAPEREQRQISATLRTVDRKIAVEEQRRVALSTFFWTILRDLTTGRFRIPASGYLSSLP